MTEPSTKVAAGRLLEFIASTLQPKFAVALVRHATADGTELTEEDVESVAAALPAASAGRPVQELDVAVQQLLGQQRAAGAAAGAGAPAPHASFAADWPAVPLGDSRSQRSVGRYLDRSSGCCDPCEIGATELFPPYVEDPSALISEEYVTAAAVLAGVYQYGDRIGFFAAVDRAIEQLDGNQLCIDDPELQNWLYCWHERDDRVQVEERARLAARVLGLRDPHLPADVRPDHILPRLLDDLLEAINVRCDPGCCHDHHPASTNDQRLESAARAVQMHLSSTVTGLLTLRIRDLQVQFGKAQQILRGLARFVHALCRPGGAVRLRSETADSQEWIAVTAMLGSQLPDGTDIFSAALTASAWRVVFDWLIDSIPEVELPSQEVCDAAALLRKDYSRRC